MSDSIETEIQKIIDFIDTHPFDDVEYDKNSKGDLVPDYYSRPTVNALDVVKEYCYSIKNLSLEINHI